MIFGAHIAINFEILKIRIKAVNSSLAMHPKVPIRFVLRYKSKASPGPSRFKTDAEPLSRFGPATSLCRVQLFRQARQRSVASVAFFYLCLYLPPPSTGPRLRCRPPRSQAESNDCVLGRQAISSNWLQLRGSTILQNSVFRARTNFQRFKKGAFSLGIWPLTVLC
jgi:hypothetical protein